MPVDGRVFGFGLGSGGAAASFFDIAGVAAASCCAFVVHVAAFSGETAVARPATYFANARATAGVARAANS